ncbi:ABC transporter permease [Pseudothioclava arenosa]|uniref:ABC transporter permease n=1 Tax=Pseudothioclava arenosa TaxID=1795308 RepID=A0A2A4CPN2_9RHOB|nr:ABC transporter permease [Pseudothioclava arenosa]PCD77201.1 ABC transporter permease [Pseudothioclava arenosa]
MVSVLDRKLIRDLRRLWAQVLAIAAVLACGVMVLVLGEGLQSSLAQSRDTYYERQRFADVFATLTRAPRTLLPELAEIEGVASLTARVEAAALIGLPEMDEPVSARVLSLPASGEPALNLPLLVTGRLPSALHPDEVALYAPFAEAHELMPGAQIEAVIRGTRRSLLVTGHVLSPEFVYTIGPGQMMPDDRRYGVIWMGEEALAGAADMQGAFNALMVGLTRGANAQAVIDALDDRLARFGGAGAHDRDGQISHAFLASEIDQLGTMALVLPPIFLAVSAFLVNMVLSRLIALERQQIGLLKAVGYTTAAITAHYLKLSLGIGLIGTLIGWGAGARLSLGMTRMYAEFFRLPVLIYNPSSWPFALSAALAALTVLAGAWRAVGASVRLSPAIAMLPPAPPSFRRGLVDGLGTALRLRQTTMMILRGITRWPGRAAITLFGVSASVSVLIASFFLSDAMALMTDEVFYQANRQNVTLTLSQAQTDRALLDAVHLPGVLVAEGSFSLPVRLVVGPREELTSITAFSEGATLSRLIDDEGRAVALPDAGLVLPEGLADKLGLRTGDRLRVEALAPPRETWELPLAATIRQTIGQEAYMARPALFALMRQVPQVNRIDLLVDAPALPALYAEAKRRPEIAGLTAWDAVREQFEATIGENVLISVIVYTTLGVLITVGVVYNAARIRLSERAHELASLRVLGFHRSEVGMVLIGETAALTLAAIPLGWIAGYGFAALMTQAFTTDLVALPLVIERATYATASLIALAAALVSTLAVRRRLDRIDIVQALKARD